MVATAPEDMASRATFLYNPPNKPPRPFAEDYKNGVSGEPGSPLLVDTGSPLLVDNRGTALRARTIVGRRTVGGGDEALPPERLESSAASLIGSSPQRVTARSIGGDAGKFRPDYDPQGNPEYKIFGDKNR